MTHRTSFAAKIIRSQLVWGMVVVSVAGCSRQAATDRGKTPPAEVTMIDVVPREERYIGADRCAACHPNEHASYALTGHSRALGEIDLAQEPPDGEFADPRSQRHYRIYRREGELHHEESIRTSAGAKLVLEDQPVRYVIGSGHFSRSYLVERDGYLFESPATWYAATSQWGLSPGYDQVNAGFQRPVELRCLICHAGLIEPVERSPQRVTFHALSIDCERCHGPGGAHAEKWSQQPTALHAGEHDDTIVNPALLDRTRTEDLCAQCHLHSAATVELRGRSLLDYRPGQRLTDYLAHFTPKETKTRMEVVGHVEQLRQSRCYQSSSSLTCMTCHDMHSHMDATSRRQAQREHCLTCHAVSACKLPLETRSLKQPGDDCMACHMPRSPTEIPHFAFTHHRIGIHKDDDPSAQPADIERELAVLAASPELHPLDELRNLGFAYLQFSDAPGESSRAVAYRARAFQLLTKANTGGLRDAEVEAALARLTWNRDGEATIRHATAALQDPQLSPDGFATACFTLGSTYYSQNAPQQALPWIQQALRSRPTADLWMMLSDCLHAAGKRSEAIEAAEAATRAAPDRPYYLKQLLILRAQHDSSAIHGTDRLRLEELWKYRARVDSVSPSR